MKSQWTKTIFLAAFAWTAAVVPALADKSTTHISGWGFVKNSKRENMAGLKGNLCLTAYFKKGGTDTKCLEITTNKYAQMWPAFSFVSWEKDDHPVNFSGTWQTAGSNDRITAGIDFWDVKFVSSEWDRQRFTVYTQPVNIFFYLP